MSNTVKAKKQTLKRVSWLVPSSFDDGWYERATPGARAKAMQLGQDLLEHWKQLKSAQDGKSKSIERIAWEQEMNTRL